MKNPLNKVLIIAPAWVGDMVMAQTLFKLLKQRIPDLIIDVLASNVTRPILLRMPEVHQTLSLPFGHGELKFFQRWKMGRDLQVKGYDQAIILPNSFKSAVLPYAAKIPVRTGWQRELRGWLLNDGRKLNKNKLPLMIQRFIALGLPKGMEVPTSPLWPELRIDADNTIKVLRKLELNAKDKPMMAICPGAEYGPAKRWLPQYYAEVAMAKIKEGWQVWIFGGPKDQQVASEIQNNANHSCIDLTGKTSLLDAIDLMALSRVVVTNDSGLMHIAAAVNRPLVVIYGSSSPQFTPPLANRVKILSLNLECSPCFKRICPLGHFRCMRDLKAAKVLQALNEVENK